VTAAAPPLRRFVAALVWAAAVLAAPATGADPPRDQVAARGPAAPGLEPFDRLMESFVAGRGAPGASLAVSKGGRLVYARGFGHADPGRAGPVGPDSLFRIASLSKPLTAVAVLALVERGDLSLDDRVVDRLGPELVAGGRPSVDLRWGDVTLQHLLQHRGGWDRGVSFDPMFRAVRIARELGVEPPAGPTDVIRWMLGEPLDFDPGGRYAYSNFGYCLLGRVIERAAGVPYEEAVARLVLRPLGVPADAMRLGKTLPAGRAPREVTYFDGDRTGPSVFPPVGEQVPEPYGAWNVEAMDAHGGWLATAPALLRVARALDGPGRAGGLRPGSVALMLERPPGDAGFEADGTPRATHYGLGWNVRPVEGGRPTAWHTGSLPGTSTLLVRRSDGLSWAVLFNAREGADGEVFSRLIDPLLHRAADAVKAWPEGDLFDDPAVHGVPAND